MRAFSIVALSVLLSACGVVAPLVVPVATVEGVSLITTEKAVEDHVYSAYKQKNCSAVRVEKGETYCREDEPNPTPAVHCYRTLGDITCYSRPDPSYGEGRQVGQPETTLRTR